MKRKIAAAVAFMMAMSICCTGCKNKTEENVNSPDIEVIKDGSVVTPAEGSEGEETDNSETSVTTEFVDPADLLGFNNDEPDVTDENGENVPADTTMTEATLPPNHEDIVEMISNADSDAAVVTKPPVLATYNVDCTTRYGYSQLNDAEKKLYKDILDAATSIRLRVNVDESVTDEMWVKVYGCVTTQEPQLFWLASKKVQKGKLWYWEIDRDIIANMQAEVDKQVGYILGQAEGKSTFEKLVVFHDWIVLNNNFVKDDSGYNQSIYGAFTRGVIQCNGYAKAMQYLCDLSGIESMVVVGSNKDNETHAWNVVKVDGKWYNLDSTWDDPILKEVDTTNLRHRYFLVPDSWIHEKSHFNVNKKITGTKVKFFDPPACTDDAMNYFAGKNILYSDAASADAALREALKKSASAKVRVAEIRAANQSVYDSVTANLKDYASFIKSENSSVTSVSSNCDPNTLVIELDLSY